MRDDLLRWLVPAFVCLAIALAWSNHFGNGFHWDDDLLKQAQHRPLLRATFALDNSLASRPDPAVFQIDTFVWFVALLLSLYGLFYAMPGGSHLFAVIAAGLFALHPGVADTVNHVSQRGVVITTFGVVAGLFVWIVWPNKLPQRLWAPPQRTVENWQEDKARLRVERRNARYRQLIHFPRGLFLIPVGLGLLAGLQAAVFAPLLLLYVLMRPLTKSRIILFGLGWFLIAFACSFLFPGSGMFLAWIGLVLASAQGVRLICTGRSWVSLVVGTIALSVLGWTTFERNKIWASDDDLWEARIAENPQNADALIHSGKDPYLRRAEPLVAGHASLETDLALAFDREGKPDLAEKHLQSAMAADPKYWRAYSEWAQWLSGHDRTKEAFDAATKAVAIEPGDLTSLHTLTDIYSQRFDWGKVKETAEKALVVAPDDPGARNSLELAQASLDEMDRLAHPAAGEERPEDDLKLSVLYFQSKRFADSIAAAQSALKLKPTMAEALVNIAAADHELGKDDDAIAALREATRLRPDLTVAKQNLDFLLAKKTEPGASR